jgi:hypothetical protein
MMQQDTPDDFVIAPGSLTASASSARSPFPLSGWTIATMSLWIHASSARPT